MLFPTLAVASILALATSVAAQVVVTVTSTVTIVTVTLTPASTSTSTKFVTVSAPSPAPTTYTSTSVVTVTVGITSTQATTCPIAVYDQCGGKDWTGCTRCISTAACKSTNVLENDSNFKFVRRYQYQVTLRMHNIRLFAFRVARFRNSGLA
ncbi:hypothetical protein VTL71DRAFT_13192 [Oculimacula yallundae]|uniref:CBM1 domain-containing protein n=1 Tax=Oculimacula yallundae TaxID=86028 RepID=A0ABR4CJM7_9HELO